ncbi:unnamed protein product [Ectocarpus sp. 8 AP-2014]
MKINTSKVAPIPSRYSPDLFATIQWMLSKTRHKRPRMGDLVKVPGLQLPLRENRLLVQEFQLEQSYLRRLRTLKSREVDIERREAELATGEARLRYRSERALAALNSQRERRKEEEQQQGGDKRTVAGGGGHPGCCFCFPRGSPLPAAGVGAANGHEARPSPPRLHHRQAHHHLDVQNEERRQRQQQQQAPSPASLARQASQQAPSPASRVRQASPSTTGSSSAFGGREAVAERGATAGKQRKTPRRERECRGVTGEDVTTLLRRRRRGADADAEGSAAPGSGGSDSSRRGEEVAKPEYCYASPTSGDKSDLRTPNAADATTAVLDYASLVLHRDASRHVSPIVHRSSSGSTDADSGERVVAREQGESAVRRERASECGGGGGGRGDPNSTVKTADDDDDDAVGTTAVVSPPRPSPCLDETAPMGSHEGETFAAPTPPPPPRRQQPRNRYRYNRHDDHHEDRASSPAGEGRRRRARGGWDDNGGELHSTRTEAVMAAGRKARESYAGFMETIAAARDLGTWAAPVPPPPPPPQQRRDHGVNNNHNKENAYASSPAAAAATAAAEYSHNTPLAELPNGRAAGAPHISSLMASVSARARPAGDGGVTGGALAAKSQRRREFMGAAAPLS